MILLSFDTEEFDVPKEHGVDFSLEDGMAVSVVGTTRILDILKENGVKATFFCTSNFVKNAPEIMKRIAGEGHEIACHGCDHWTPKASDVRESKEIIENLMGRECRGYRQPRMFPVSDSEIEACGYRYNSSLNPAFIPGKYIHLASPRTCFMKGKVLQIPASVTPLVRFPLFWLSLHNLPERIYHKLVLRTLEHDGYFVTYFHPWEFIDLKKPQYKMPFVSKNHSGLEMCGRLDRFVKMLISKGENFITFSEFTDLKISDYD